MLRKWFLPALVILGLTLSACSGVGGPKTAKVAVSLPLGIELGKDMLNAVQLALDEAGGKAGKVTVELLVFNSSDPEGSPVSPQFEQEAVLQAVKDPAVVAYLGAAASDQARVSMPILNEASITQISPSATWPGLTKPGYGPGEPGIYYPTGRRHFFRTLPSDDIQGVAAARWVSQLGFKTVYIVDNDTAYGRGIAGIFEASAQDFGIQIVAHDRFSADSVTPEELATIAARVVEAQPDLLYFGGGAESKGSEFVGAVRSLDPDFPIMGADGMMQDLLITDNGAELVEGIYATNGTIPVAQMDSAAAAAFLAKYRATYGKEPPPYAATSYEAMKVLLYAIEQAKEPTREGVLDAMQNLGEFSGIFGQWHFDERGDTSIPAISAMQIQNGAWTFIKVLK